MKNIKTVELKPWGFNYSSDLSEAIAPVSEDNLPVLGLPLFKNYVITLDFAHKNIRVDDRNEPVQNDNKWINFPYRYHPKEGLVIGITDKSKYFNMVLDTGATMSIVAGRSLSEKFNNSLNTSTGKVNEPNLRLEKNGEPQTIRIYLDNPLIGKLPIRAAIMDGMPKEFESDGLLGMDFLKRYMVKIDQKNQKLWIRPAF